MRLGQKELRPKSSAVNAANLVPECFDVGHGWVTVGSAYLDTSRAVGGQNEEFVHQRIHKGSVVGNEEQHARVGRDVVLQHSHDLGTAEEVGERAAPMLAPTILREA